MGPFGMVVLIILIATVGKIVQTWVSRSPGPSLADGDSRIRALEDELRANEARLALTEDRVADLTEKLSFVEGLLAQPEQVPRIPASKG